MFKPGKSGNPAGRPPGSGKHQEIRDALELHRMDLVAKAVSMALAGDCAALKLCLDRICPPIKAQSPTIGVTVEKDADLPELGNAAIRAMLQSRIPPEDCASIMKVLVSQSKLVEMSELERRVTELENVEVNIPPNGRDRPRSTSEFIQNLLPDDD